MWQDSEAMTHTHDLPHGVDMAILEVRLQSERAEFAARLHEIEQALARISDGSYGICTQCGRTIDPVRLNALPATRQCRDCQQGFEQRRGLVRNPA